VFLVFRLPKVPGREVSSESMFFVVVCIFVAALSSGGWVGRAAVVLVSGVALGLVWYFL
jgi:hypothetical protein